MTEPTTGVILAIEIEIEIDIETSGGRFHQLDGKPVWPVSNLEERESLERMVTKLGATLKFVSEADERRLTGEQLVVGLGAGAHTHAQLYAHLTSRACELVETLEQLSSFPQAAVVVTTYAHVNEQLMDLLYDRHPLRSAPGVIFSYDDAQLSSQVLVRAAARHCSHDNFQRRRVTFQRRRVDVNPTINFGAQMSREFSIVGGQAKPSEFREALGCGAGLLTLYTHSDGIDAYLREDLVLCPIESADRSSQPEPAPSCVLTGICHRCRRPMSEVIGTDVLMAPDLVNANVLVYCVCWGLYPSQHVHSPAYALSRRLLENFSIGALVTSWEINIQRLPLTANLFHDIARGLPLGEALARHLASPEARSNYHKLCLIGDPEIRLPPLQVDDPLANIQHFKKPPAPSARCMAGLTLLRLMINSFSAGADDSDAQTAVALAVASIGEYEAMLVEGLRYDPELAARFRREMLNYLTSQDTMLSKCWSQFCETLNVVPEKPPCPVCGRRTIVREFSLRIPGAKSRRETMCPSCGSIEDCPSDRGMSMSVAPDGLMRLHGALPKSDWCARISVERFFTRETYQWDWPAAPSGEPMPSFQVPRAWPLVPFRLSVIIVHGDSDFSVLGCLYRGGLEGEAERPS